MSDNLKLSKEQIARDFVEGFYKKEWLDKNMNRFNSTRMFVAGYDKGKADTRKEVVEEMKKYIDEHHVDNWAKQDLLELLDQLKKGA